MTKFKKGDLVVDENGCFWHFVDDENHYQLFNNHIEYAWSFTYHGEDKFRLAEKEDYVRLIDLCLDVELRMKEVLEYRQSEANNDSSGL